MPKRRFEYIDDRSCKFWEIASDDEKVTVTFGRIGAQGQTQTKTFDDAKAAKKHVAKLIKAKTKKGYAEVIGA